MEYKYPNVSIFFNKFKGQHQSSKQKEVSACRHTCTLSVQATHWAAEPAAGWFVGSFVLVRR